MLTSSIEHPASSIEHPASSIEYRASSIEHPASEAQIDRHIAPRLVDDETGSVRVAKVRAVLVEGRGERFSPAQPRNRGVAE